MKRTLDADKEEWDIIDDGTIDDSCDASVRAFTRNVSRTSYASYSQSSFPSDVPRRFTTCDRLPMLTAVWKRREVAVRVLYGLDQAVMAGSSAASRKRSGLFMDDSPASLWSATDGSEYDERPRKRGRPGGSTNRVNGIEFKRGPGRPRKDSQNFVHSDAARAISFSVGQPSKRGPGRPPKTSLKPPPQGSFSHVPMYPSYPGTSSPITSSPRSTARARSQPPSSSRTSPGRAAALLSLGHHQLLHSPLVRVRHTRPIVPEVVRFSLPPSPSPPSVPVARSSRGRSLTPSNRVSSFAHFNEPTQPSRSRSLDRDRSAPRQRKPASAPRRHSSSTAKASPILDTRWKNYALKLRAFREKHGTCRVPRVLPEDQSFANWVHNQRYSKTLTKERIDLLNEIGFEWLPLSTNTPRSFEMSCSGNSRPAAPPESDAAGEEAIPQVSAQAEEGVDASAPAEVADSNRNEIIQSEPFESEPPADESAPMKSEEQDVSSSPQASRWSRRARGRQPAPRMEATQGVVSNDESSVSPPIRDSGDDQLREVELSEPPQEPTPAVQSGGIRTTRRSKRQKWTSDEPPEDSSSLVAPSIPPTETIAEELPGASVDDSTNCIPRTRMSMRSPSSGVAAPGSPTSLTAVDKVVQTVTRGRSRTCAVVSAPTPTRKACSQPSRDEDDGSDADDSSESSEGDPQLHCNSPLVRRSIRKRKGRHVSQRNEVPAPESPLARDEAPGSPPRKRHKAVSSVSEMETAKSKSPVKKASSHKGTMSRELLSLLQDYRPRTRRTGTAPGSARRSVLQN
jgi:Helicase associated domain